MLRGHPSPPIMGCSQPSWAPLQPHRVRNPLLSFYPNGRLRWLLRSICQLALAASSLPRALSSFLIWERQWGQSQGMAPVSSQHRGSPAASSVPNSRSIPASPSGTPYLSLLALQVPGHALQVPGQALQVTGQALQGCHRGLEVTQRVGNALLA